MNWKPIETAPINREDVLLWTPSGMLVGFRYVRDRWHASGVKASDESCNVELYEAPTHWMPLPAEPGASKCKEGDCPYYGSNRPSTCECFKEG